jgi:hypothetical protein
MFILGKMHPARRMSKSYLCTYIICALTAEGALCSGLLTDVYSKSTLTGQYKKVALAGGQIYVYQFPEINRNCNFRETILLFNGLEGFVERYCSQ